MKKYLIILLINFSFIITYGEGLFDSAFDLSESETENLSYEMNGYIKSGIFSNKDFNDFQSSISELDLNITVNKNKFGNVYSDFRINKSESKTELELRESYVNFFTGPFDFKLGDQIIVWGRADGYNPTDIINPKNNLIHSATEDDKRISNYIINGSYNINDFRLETVVIPKIKFSKLASNTYSEAEYTDKIAKALKLNYENPDFDSSVSYYNGYSINRGLYKENSETSPVLMPYEYQMFGFDYARTIKNTYGFRTEIAYKKTNNYKNKVYMPNPEIEVIIGGDKNLMNNLNLILQYYGKYVENWEKTKTGDLMDLNNKIISRQLEEIQHSLIWRLRWDIMYERLHLENVSNYNFTTEELYLKLMASYDLTDAFTLTAGSKFYTGPKNTLYNLVDEDGNTSYLEVKVLF